MMGILNDKILYVGEHLSCNQYMHDVDCGFTLRNFIAGYSEEISSLKKNVILFVLDGKLLISYDIFKNVKVGNSNFVFLPKNANISYKVEENASIIIFTFDNLLSGCDQNLLATCRKIFESSSYEFKALVMCEPIQQYCNLLKYCLEKGVNCSHFHEMKHKEFFMYMRYFYTKEEVTNFLYPIIGLKSDFKHFILQNWKIGMNIDDVVKMLPMSKSTFIRTFNEYFNVTPYTWYQKQICNKIVERAVYPGATLKDLMNEAMITDASQFNRFCKRNFSCTPKQLLQKYSCSDSFIK